MKNSRKIMVSVIVLIIGIAVIWGTAKIYISHNLNKYAFYYVTHMTEDKGRYQAVREIEQHALPEKVNAKFQSNINLTKKRGGLYANMGKGIVTADDILKKGDYWRLNEKFIAYYPYGTKKDGLVLITLTKNYQVEEINYYDGIKKSQVSEKQILSVLDNLIAELKKTSKRPDVNLQKLYDKRMKSNE